MSKYYVIKVRILCDDQSVVKLSDYITTDSSGDDDTLEYAIPDLLKSFYYRDASKYQSDLGSPIADTSDGNQISTSITFDYDKIKDNINGGYNVVDKIYDVVIKALKGARPDSPVRKGAILAGKITGDDPATGYKMSDYRDNSKYQLISNAENNGVNTSIDVQNGGGWQMLFRINAPRVSATQSQPTSSPTQSSATQSSPQVVVAPTQSTPPLAPNQPVAQETSKGEVIGSNNNNNTNSNKKNTDGKFPGITSVSTPTIKLDPIKMKMPSNDADRKEFTKGLGYLPFVWYNGYQINYSDIRLFSLYHDGIIPKCKIVFKDTFNIMKSSGFPLDDTKIQIFINAKSKNLKSIHMEFKVQNFQDGGDNTYTIFGTVNIPQLYLKKYKSYSQKTSSETIQEVCKELSIGFNSNLDNSDDKMTWINPGKKGFQFLDDVILNSYKSDSSFLIGYIDYYYCFNYVDIEKELARDTKNDIGVDTGGLSANSDKQEDDRLASLILTNDGGFKDSCMYFNKWKVRNDSTSISLKKGYLSKVKFYEDVNKDFLVFDVDSITSEGTKTVILKGAPQDESYFKDNYSSVWMGKIDMDNSHKNFNYSVVQNRLNLDELVKISIDIELPNPNFNLYKFQKIYISFINTSQTPTTGLIQERLKGDWLIIDVSFVFSGGKMKQMIKAIKRELSVSDDERGGPPPPGKKEQGEINENPSTIASPADPAPNPGPTSSNPTETQTPPDTKHKLDLIPGSYVNNSGSKIQLCQIDGKPVNVTIADAYLNMKEAATKAGISIKVQSGFRSPYDPINATSEGGSKVSASSQQQLYQAYLDGKGNLAAKPGASNHGNGIGLDLSTGSRKAASNGPLNTKVYDWLIKNSWRYGFIRAVATEEWHFDYLPSLASSGPYAKLNSSKRDANRFYADLGLDKLDDITKTA